MFMKKIHKLTLVLILVLAASFQQVKAQKIAHINSQELIVAMPEYKALQEKLNKLGKSYQDEITKMENELTAKLEKYNKEAASQTEETNLARQKEVQMENQKLEQYKVEAAQELQKQEQEGMQPILDKAQKAVEEVAKEQGIQYVLNASALIVAEGKDLLPDVKAKLGI